MQTPKPSFETTLRSLRRRRIAITGGVALTLLVAAAVVTKKSPQQRHEQQVRNNAILAEVKSEISARPSLPRERSITTVSGSSGNTYRVIVEDRYVRKGEKCAFVRVTEIGKAAAPLFSPWADTRAAGNVCLG